MPNYRLVRLDTDEVLKVRHMDYQVAEVLNEQLEEGYRWFQGLAHWPEARPKSLASRLLRNLNLEGFNEYSMNTIERFLDSEHTEMNKRRERYIACKERFAGIMRELPEEHRRVVGAFMSFLNSDAFEAGLRLGMAGRLHREVFDKDADAEKAS